MDTHDELIGQAARWLRTKGCSVVITDMTSIAFETPDALGWRGSTSILIECKASRSDFKADAQKGFRREPERGMGALRYFCAPAGLIPVSSLPPKWGLLELSSGKLREVQKPVRQPHCENAEIRLLLSAIRRMGASTVTGISVKFYTYLTQNRATLGVAVDPGNSSLAEDSQRETSNPS